MASSGMVAMGTSLGVEYAFARLTHAGAQGTLVAMLLGAVVAMMGSMALSGPGIWTKVRTAVFFPVAIGVGMGAGVAVGNNTDLMLGVFVAVMFLAVFVRRFGPVFFFYGFMTWMGYFFASFLQADLSALPSLVVAVAVSSAWVLLLSVTVLRTDSRRTLMRTVSAYDARARAVARACAELLDMPPGEPRRHIRWRRRLLARQAGLAEAALMVEGWSEEPRALPAGWSGPAVRRRLLERQQVLDRLAASAVALAGKDPALVAAAGEVADAIARRHDAQAGAAARRLAELAQRAESTDTPGWWPARHLAVAALELLEFADVAEDPPTVDPVDEYAATATLAMGNLPGAPAVAADVPARGAAWNPLARLDMTTRQALQVAVAGALAIYFGRELSSIRYYWAVIAAFVAFTGTATRTETFVKAVSRVVGTLAGLVVAIWLANLTAGHTALVLVVILGAMFCGFYLVRIGYAYMIFFITIMVGQLYSVLHEFSDGLLVLRLEETAIGAACGIAVALLLIPLSTRDTVRSARDSLLTALAELLGAVADRLESSPGTTDLDALSRALDNRVRQLALVAKPLTRPLVWGNSSPRTRHRLALYSATAAHARALTVGLRRSPPDHRDDVAAACRALADAAYRLTEAAPGRPTPSLQEPLSAADGALYRSRVDAAGARATDPVLRPLIHLHGVLSELGVRPGDVEASPPAPSAAISG
jgi:uncharacterized membrane protein YccC